MSPDAVSDLAGHIVAPADKPVQVRIAVITSVQAAVGRKVQTDQTGTAWVARSEDASLAVGDRVWLLQQGGVYIVGGRLTGEAAGLPVGTIQMYAGATPPAGWMICDGSAISRTTYASLFSVTSTAYGVGNGSTTFNLPNLAAKFPLGASGARPVGTTGGAETVALTTGELPAHTHGSAGSHIHQYELRSTAGTATGAQGVSSTGPGVFNDTEPNGTHTHASVGNGEGHENMPPFVTILYIIRVL